MSLNQETKIQHLDKDAFEYIKSEKTKGRNYADISKDLVGLGYTRATGRELTALDISVFACKNGFRQMSKHTKSKKPSGAAALNGAKTLTNENFDEIVKMRAQGMGVIQIADAFTLRGYQTPAGGKYHGSDISKYLIKRGVRKNKTYKKEQRGQNLNVQIASPINAAKLNQDFIAASSAKNAESFIEQYVMTSHLLTTKQKLAVSNLLLN